MNFDTHNKEVLVFSKENKQGLVNLKSEELIPPIYEEISILSEEFYVAGKIIEGNLKFGYLNAIGEEVTKFIFEDAHLFNNGYAPVKINTGWTFLDKSFIPISDKRFEMVKDFNEGFAEVKLINNQWSFINTDGDLITEQTFEKTRAFSFGMAVIQRGDKFGYLNTKGEVQIPPIFEHWRDFSEHGTAVIANEELGWKMIRKNGQIIPEDPTIFVKYPHVFDNGLFKVTKKQGRKWKIGYMNLSGEIIIPIIYDQIGGFHYHTIISGIIGNKYYLVNEKGIQIKETDYSDIYNYYEGRVAMVFRNRKMGVIDKHGNESVPCIYTDLSPMYSAYNYISQFLFVAKKPRSSYKGVITETNEVIIPFEWDDIYYISEDAFLVSKKDTLCIYRANTKEVISVEDSNLEINHIERLTKNYLSVKDKTTGLLGLMNIEGKLLLQPQFTFLAIGGKVDNRDIYG